MSQPQKVQRQFTSFSHSGWQRSNNEDALLVDDTLGIFLLADGMGGHAGGEVASQMACEQVHTALSQQLDITEAVALAHQQILMLGQQQPELNGLGTTLVAAQIRADKLQLSWVGDSRIYRYRSGKLQQLSEDHSFVQQLVSRGVLTPAEADEHPQRHLLQQALGQLSGKTPKPSFCLEDYQQDDLYLLCSDGVSDVLSEAALASCLAHQPPLTQDELERLAQQLLAAVLATDAPDNASGILLQILSGNKIPVWRRWLGL
jgi:serine/threonine protein phosphatase PrpC